MVTTAISAYPLSPSTRQPPRYGLDDWENMMMERDRRLTGSVRGQRVSSSLEPVAVSEEVSLLRPKRCTTTMEKTDPVAPKEFASNSIWGTEKI